MKSLAKKVLFTSHTANFQKFNRPFMRMLKEQGYTVHYASAGEEKVYDTDEHFDVPFERSPFKIGNIKAYFQLKKIINREKYDLIHTHTPMGSVVTRLAARNARKKGTRVIYTAHGFHFFKGAPLLNWIIYYPIEKLMARHTDTLITINNEDYERAKKNFKTDVEYVPGVGVDKNRFNTKLSSEGRKATRLSLGLKSRDFVMIYPAEISKRKRQVWMINSIASLMLKNPSMHLLLPGSDSMNGYCQRMVQELGLTKQIHFLGYRNDIDVLMAASELAVSSSSQEGLPVNLLEALASGLEVIATDCRGNRDILQNQKGSVLVDVQDSKAFSEAIATTFLTKGKVKTGLPEANSIQSVKEIMINLYEPNHSSKIQSPIRILHVVTSMNRAGLETMLMNYYRNIDRTKIQFDFVVHRIELGEYEDEIRSLGGKVFRFEPISIVGMLTYRKKFSNFLREHQEYSTVHAHLDSLSGLPLSGAKDAGVRNRIAHSHNSGFSKDSKLLIRLVAKKFIPLYATKFIGCSNEAAQFMFGKKVSYNVVPNAVDISSFSFNQDVRNKVRQENGLNDKFVVGHVGRFTDQKNHSFLIDIFYEISKLRKDSHLLLIGEGEYEDQIRRKIATLSIGDQVTILSKRSDIGDLMQAMDIFVLPSKYEGLPVVAIEAQASGLPIILNENVSREVDLTGDVRFVELGIKEWTESVNSTKSQRRLASVKKVAKSSYDISVSARSLQEAYLNV